MSSAAKSATAGSDRGGSPTRSPRKLTQEELQRSTQRLHATTRSEVQLKPLVDPVKLSKADEEKSVHRLFNDAVDAQKRRQVELAKRLEEQTPKPPSTKTLGQSEEQETICRLYEKSVQHKSVVAADLEKKFVPELSQKKLDAGIQEEVNKRLYNECIAKKKDSKTKLYEKYILDVEPKGAKRTAEELKASAARLHAGDK